MRRFAAVGFSLVELLLVLAIFGTVAGIAIPLYFRAIEHARTVRAISDITTISLEISSYRAANNTFPASLSDVGEDQRKDPWGHVYSYLLIAGVKNPQGVRKDKNLHPINSDFDLYSMGPNGKSAAPLTSNNSQDDIIRANDGTFIGVAANY
jgi:general secretion pathway protein G